MSSIADLRREYARAALDERTVDPDPIRQFAKWFEEARAAQTAAEPNAMTLATATPDGVPTARIVLLKGVAADGFVFYTDYRSRKGMDLAANPQAALVFFWAELERQVRIEGRVARVTHEQSDGYFKSRPLGSRVAAWTSHQSEVLASRETLERAYERMQGRFEKGDVPLPPYWGGFRVIPSAMEFWQGRPSRLHDRLRYEREADDAWHFPIRLSP